MAILNDHQITDAGQSWRDHLGRYAPQKSVEWERWISCNQKTMSQIDFAEWLERNMGDIANAEGFPTGTAMLQMATNLEVSQDSKFRSALRLQSGGVRMEYVQDDDAGTVASMEVFSKFALGIPVFRGGEAYKVEARLKYRLKEGRLTFSYELMRADQTLEAAAKTMTQAIGNVTGFPLFHGNPFAR